MRDGRWKSTIKAYRPTNKGGGLALEVSHSSVGARTAEIEAVKSLIRKGHYGKAILIWHVEPYTTTEILP